MNPFDRGVRTPRRWREPNVRLPSVRWSNLPLWLAKTAAVDLRDYDGRRRRLTLSRLRASLPPRITQPIFILGSPRSGTSFLGGCIGALDSVSYHREPVIMKAVGKHIWGGDWSPEHARRIYRLTYGLLLGLHLAGDLRLAEKSPHNVFVVPSLAAAFPDAQFIHIVRDGRDASVSYLEKPWVRQVFAWTHRRDPGGQPYGPFAPFWVEGERRAEFESTSDLHRAVWTWRRHVEAAEAGAREVAGDRWLDVRYESLQTAPTSEAERILDFLRVERAAERAQLVEALGTANSGSIGRWRQRLNEDDLAVVEREAGKLLARLGYT